VDGQVLGNVRSVITPDANNKPVVTQANDYFPFGMSFESPIPNLSYKSTTNKHKYNGKEEQEMPGNWLDYGARFYDAQIGRWHGVDPLAEKYFPISPYTYVANNPVIYVDPDGREIKVAGKKKEDTYLNLAIIYGTPLGRKIIDELHDSNRTYTIHTTSRKNSTFNRGKIKYNPKQFSEEGTVFRGFESLSHELWHAYQDLNGNIKGRTIADVEAEAMKFENYIRKIYSDGSGPQRTRYQGSEIFRSGEQTSFPTGGIQKDVNSVNTYVTVIGGDGSAKQGPDDLIKQDNTAVSNNVIIDIQRIFEYMDNNNVRSVKIKF
jgi:RHS repeat-associated protein